MEQLTTREQKFFLNRPKEIGFIDDVLRLLSISSGEQHNIEQTPLRFALYFYGVGRLGKSSILGQIYKKAKKEKTLEGSLVFIDFDYKKKYDGLEGRDEILMEFLKQLNVPFDRYQGRASENEDLFISSLINYLKETKRVYTLILLIDTLEQVSPENFKWLQEKIIVPFINEFKILVAYAGRKKLIETQLYFPWDVKRYLKNFPLERFSEKQTRDHIRKLLVDEDKQIPKDIMEITGGIPGLNEEVARKINTDFSKTPVDSQLLLLHIVNNIIFTGKNDTIFYKDDLMYVSVCRQFEARLLDNLVKELGWRNYSEEAVKSATMLIQKMLGTTLLENHPDGYGYVFAGNYRRIVDRYFRDEYPQIHFQAHVICYQWYQKEVEKNDWVAISDQIYHLVGAWHDLSRYTDLDINLINALPEPFDRKDKLVKLLSSTLEKLEDNNRSFTIINKIKWTLESEEFSWFMSQVEIDELIKLCNSKLNKKKS